MSARGSAELDPDQGAKAGIFSSPLGQSDRHGFVGAEPQEAETSFKQSNEEGLNSPSDNAPPEPNFVTCAVGSYDCTQRKGPIIPRLFSFYQIANEMQPFAWMPSDDGRVTLLAKLNADLSEILPKMIKTLANSDKPAAIYKAVFA
ncbi:MAG: hypothetical protein ACKO45_14755 [Cyanobium sp.]